ncbi:MAG: 16S rRNA (guanine(527)-N(7))-methyltransferase RsmG [Bauldia sp.]|nr:16S rRNA (guanine(527)-N(7))-methyltransferase RsmG [Bauldia sp.]
MQHPPSPNAATSPETAVARAGLAGVSRETLARLSRYVDLLRDWQRVKNLVAPGTLDAVWERHVADSAQLVALAPDARRWLDLGSGAGFPGMVVAILLAETPGARVDLVEANSRKAAFLRTVARETGAPAVVHAGRIEDVIASWREPVDAISARAFAPLVEFCALAAPLLARGVPAWLHKGADFAAEREEASHAWNLDLVEHPSRLGSGVIVELRRAVPRPASRRP